MVYDPTLFDDEEEHCRCPVCGSDMGVGEVHDEGNICRRNKHGPFKREELIGTYDDYEWVV